MFLLPIKLDRVSFETKGRQNLQKTADFLIESIVFCPLVPPSWISLVDPTSARYASAIYVSYIYDTSSRHFEFFLKSSACIKSHLPNVENRVYINCDHRPRSVLTDGIS